MNIYAKLLGFWVIVLIWSAVRLSAQDAQVLKYILGYNGGIEIKPYGEQIINRTIVGTCAIEYAKGKGVAVVTVRRGEKRRKGNLSGDKSGRSSVLYR